MPTPDAIGEVPTVEQQHREQQASAAEELVGRLVDQGVAGVLLSWVDNSGVSRVKAVPVTRGPAYGLTRMAEQSDYLRDLLVALDRQGVEVQQIHPEYASGQFELS